MRSLLPCVSLLLVVLSLACGGDTDPGASVSPSAAEAPAPAASAEPVSHCDSIASMSTCVDYLDPSVADADCKDWNLTSTPGACPAEGRTGRCELPGKIRNYYSTGAMPNDAAYAESHCKNSMGGTPML